MVSCSAALIVELTSGTFLKIKQFRPEELFVTRYTKKTFRLIHTLQEMSYVSFKIYFIFYGFCLCVSSCKVLILDEINKIVHAAALLVPAVPCFIGTNAAHSFPQDCAANEKDSDNKTKQAGKLC